MLRRYVLCGLFGSIRLKGKQITMISKKEKRNKQFFLFPIFNLDNEVGFMTLSALFFFFLEKGVVLFFIWMLLIFASHEMVVEWSCYRYSCYCS